MAEYQRIIDEISSRLRSGDCELDDEFRQIASAYSAACRDANHRLRRCGEFLRLGLRSEAIQYADAEPSLLEMVTRLDFPEREAWEELVTMYQLPRMEPLQLDMAEMLNEAYAEQEPLQKLLASHRLMALAKSPLEQRLKVLRRLADVDRQTSFWEDDLREMEKARLSEIKLEAGAASAKGDHRRLQELVAELHGKGWRNAPPLSFFNGIEQMAGVANANWARQELEQLEANLNDAFGALDLPRAQQIRDRWNQVESQASLAFDDPLRERSAPALDWIRDEEERLAKELEYERAVRKLELALESDHANLMHLERLGHDVAKFNRGLPEPLASRYRNRVASLHFSDARRRNLIIVGAALSIFLVIGSIGYLIQRQLRSSEIQAVAATVEKMVDDGQLVDARALVEKHADFPIHASWLAVQTKLGIAEKEEQERIAQVQGLIASAESTDSYNQATEFLKQAREVARTTDEKLKIGSLESEWDERHRNEVAGRESAYRQLVDDVSDKLEKADRLLGKVDPVNRVSLSELQRADQLLQAAALQLKESRLAGMMVKSTLSSQSKLLESRLTALQETWQKLDERSKSIERISQVAMVASDADDFAARLAAYEKTLEEYSTSFPSDPRTSDFEKAKAYFPVWNGELKWQLLARQWEAMPPTELSEAIAQIEGCEKLIADYPNTPAVARAKRYLPILESIRQREQSSSGDNSESAKSRLAALFENKLLNGVYLLELKDGNKYYLAEPLKKDYSTAASSEPVNFHPILDYGLAGGSVTKGKGKIRSVGEIESFATVLAPHAIIGSRVNESIGGCSIEDWNGYCLSLCRRIIGDDEMDDFLQYFLLLRVAELAGEGDVQLKDALAPVLRRFQNDDIDLAVNWMDPESDASNNARQLAAESLTMISIQDFETAWEVAKKKTERIVEDVRSRVSVVGALIKDKEGRWRCLSNWTPNGDYQLQVAVARGTSHEWTSVGVVRGNKVALNAQLAGPHVLEGQLIFATPQGDSDLAFVGLHN